MEVTTIFALKEYWGTNGITSTNDECDINKILVTKELLLPHDFILFFKFLNGMNEQDEEGFLFYKIENLINMKRKFDFSVNSLLSDIVIFADYMYESWWYGVKTINDDEYEIGIISTAEIFKKISNSYEEFIQLYITDSPLLYEYE